MNMSEFKRICPQCFLPNPTSPIDDDDVMNSLSHDGEIYICSRCGQMESMGGIFGDAMIYGLVIANERAQAALFGLVKGRPNIPKVKLTKGQSLWYDFEKKQLEIRGNKI
jgi:hypothetical protein